ncbi:MAG: dihydropyrimidinase [Anaerolineae bacterium CFX3]|nr:dihydropyrimidinase [Anaerolineales bacterium]MCE7906462.1 dihydropyrimidinase [Anaerolineae bacterium CFX3]MCQ3947854.1 dihydropyrimidinase [Anaerolineae bacterium]MCZ2287313.1 dihydropyrimidinase [Anaerolineales bacterium]RIK25715.1 MAG: dihydropyrimidinase [Anaerolineae bacterium]
MTTLIKNGTLITASETFEADILIEGEKIARIGLDLEPGAANVVDASGKFVTPGGVDPHTHFDLPMFDTVSSDDHYTGHKAAAFGGTTTVIDFAVQEEKGFQYSMDRWMEKAQKAAIDYSFHMNLTRFDESVAKEIPSLREMGVTTLKVFTAYNGRLRLDDGSIFKALRIAGENGMLVMAHCENGDVIDTLIPEALAAGHTSPEWHARTRPAPGAVEATLRMAAMSETADAPVYIVHMNAGGEVDMLKYARERGVKVMGETCPQYLFFTVDHLRRPDGAKWVCSPPMRTEKDNARLWEGLRAGILQTVGTDHCPFFFDGTKPILYEGQEVAIPGKELGKDDFTKIPNGLPAVGDRLPILWTYGVRAGRISANQFVALTAANPAKIFGLYPRKGALLPGSDADIVIWDAEKRVQYGAAHSHHRTDYNLFEGWEVVGMPEKVFLRGKLIVDGETWLGKRGQGQFLRRKPGEVL